jgi:hypothetical protein
MRKWLGTKLTVTDSGELTVFHNFLNHNPYVTLSIL